jgi:hypothetical protein
MYLFARRARLAGGKVRDAMAWAAAITGRVNEISGLQLGLWNQTLSPAVGTVVWGAFVPDLPTLEAAFDKLAADDGYHALVAQGPEFTLPGSLDDSSVHSCELSPDQGTQDPRRGTDLGCAWREGQANRGSGCPAAMTRRVRLRRDRKRIDDDLLGQLVRALRELRRR